MIGAIHRVTAGVGRSPTSAASTRWVAAAQGVAALEQSESVAGRETTLSLRSNAATENEESSRNGEVRIDSSPSGRRRSNGFGVRGSGTRERFVGAVESLTASATPGSPGSRRRSSGSRAFTLLELLVVIGVIMLLVGGGALAIGGRGGEGAALANAQNILISMVGVTRNQAALHQTNARLVVYAQQPPSTNAADAINYLRTLQVVRQDTLANGTTVWVAAGVPVTLPTPVCVVPPAPVPANHLNIGIAWNNNVATGPVSTLVTATGFSYRGQSTATATQFFGRQGATGRIHYLEFTFDGTVVSNPTGNPTKIALSTAVLGINALPRFNNASAVRGIFVRKTGGVAMVDSATGF